MILLTFDNMKSWALISNQSNEVIMFEFLFWASVKQVQVEVHTIEPGFKVIVVLLSIN